MARVTGKDVGLRLLELAAEFDGVANTLRDQLDVFAVQLADGVARTLVMNGHSRQLNELTRQINETEHQLNERPNENTREFNELNNDFTTLPNELAAQEEWEELDERLSAIERKVFGTG